ncbi:hypothetical protein [Myxococcus fulvus]|nr:hypothetical protein [Myxococcus fulvus]
MTRKSGKVSFLLLWCVVSTSAWAQVQMISVTAPQTLPSPLAGFNVQYSMTGSKYGAGAAVAQVTFYLSSTANGSSGVYTLFTQQIGLRGSGLGPYYPPIGTQTAYINRFSMPANTVAQLEYLEAACQSSVWYVLGRVDSTTLVRDDTLIGTAKPPDFYFTAGTLSPGVIQPGGTANLSFDLYSRCPAPAASRVGVYLTDPDFQVLESIGAIPINAGSGTWSFPPTAISFSPAIAPGSYRVVLLADVDNTVAEGNEDNNGGFFTLDVTEPALATSEGPPHQLEPAPALPFDGVQALTQPTQGAAEDLASFRSAPTPR